MRRLVALWDCDMNLCVNGVRDDNRPENLELWSKSQPKGQRATDKLAWAKEIIRMYEPTQPAPCCLGDLRRIGA